MVRIRKFQNKDAPEICNLIKRNDLEITSKFYPKELIKSWISELTPEIILKKSKERICFVAEKNNHVVGYISLSGNEIKKLHILPDFHKQGIGKKLLERIENIAIKNKINKLVLKSNIDAEPFYIKCGFKKVKDDWQETDTRVKYKFIYMEKTLKENKDKFPIGGVGRNK